MATFEGDTQSPASILSKLALLVDVNRSADVPNENERALEFLGIVREVGNEEQAIKIRIARLLAWAKSQDVQQAGYPGWTAFVREHSPWRPSRTHDYVRLVESRLDVIKAAVSANEIELTAATRAPKELGSEASHEKQVQWIREVKLGVVPERHRALMDVLTGDSKRCVLKARRLGTILIGSDAPRSVIDDFLLECHTQKLTCDQVLERARVAPPAPERLGRVVPQWSNEASESLLGPWSDPTHIQHAVETLRATERLLAQRRVVLGMAYDLIRSHSLWTSVPGCNGLEELCRVHLGMTQKTFQRYAGEALRLQNPLVRKEVEEGRLTLDRANFAIERSGGSELALKSWLELMRRLGRAELYYASHERDGDLRKDYAAALTMANAVESAVRRAKDTGLNRAGPPEGTAIGATAARLADHFLAVGATGPILIALRDDSNRMAPPEPDYIYAPQGLLAAADYVLAVVELPHAYGPRRMVEHDLYTCQNPRCRRRTLRVHPHHIHEQQHGGTDDPANLVTLCPACHLRGIHSARMSVVRIDDWLGWTWPDGGVVIMDSRVSELNYESRTRRSTPLDQSNHP